MMSAIKKIYAPAPRVVSPSATVTREMSITVEQFAQNLPAIALGMLAVVSSAPGRHKLTGPDGAVRIACTRQPDRYLGSLPIPVLSVEFDFSGFDRKRVDNFMQKFDRAYLKMGA
jgi:hypothetical protein